MIVTARLRAYARRRCRGLPLETGGDDERLTRATLGRNRRAPRFGNRSPTARGFVAMTAPTRQRWTLEHAGLRVQIDAFVLPAERDEDRIGIVIDETHGRVSVVVADGA